MRLATSLKTLEETPSAVSNDLAFAGVIGKLAEAFGRAFRQAHPVLVASEGAFVALVAEEGPKEGVMAPSEETSRQAGALVHEAVLCSQEIASLLGRFLRAGRINPPMARRLLEPSLPPFAESLSAIGWELKGICHEYLAEVKLLGQEPTHLRDLPTGARALTHDMADVAGKLRAARKDWFRIDHRLASATGAVAGEAPGGPVLAGRDKKPEEPQ